MSSNIGWRTILEDIALFDQKEYRLYAFTYVQAMEMYAVIIMLLLVIPIMFSIWNCVNMSEYESFGADLYATILSLQKNGYYPQ